MLRPHVCLSPGAHIHERLLGSGSGVHSPCPRVGIWSFLHQVSPNKASTWPVASFLYSTYCPPQPGILIILCPVSPGTFDKSVQNKRRLPKGLQSYSFWFYIYINQINSFWAEIYVYFTINITARKGSFHFLLWFIQFYLFASRKSKKIVSQNIREVGVIGTESGCVSPRFLAALLSFYCFPPTSTSTRPSQLCYIVCIKLWGLTS